MGEQADKKEARIDRDGSGMASFKRHHSDRFHRLKMQGFHRAGEGVHEDDQSCAEWLSEGARFGDCLLVSAESWIHAAVWSPSGTSLAFAAYNLSIGFVDGLHGPASGWVENLDPRDMSSSPEGKLPIFVYLKSLSDNSSVTEGDCRPTLIELRDDRRWGFRTEMCGEMENEQRALWRSKSRFNSWFTHFARSLI